MLSKKKKIIILCTMLVLLVVTGYLNLTLNNSTITTNSNTTTTSSNFFVTQRNYRQETREQEILYYDAIISSTASSAEAIATAENKKLEIVKIMEQELVLEGLIKSKGFEDCVVSTSNENVSVIVKAQQLESAQVAQIVSIVQEQLGTDLGNIKILPIE